MGQGVGEEQNHAISSQGRNPMHLVVTWKNNFESPGVASLIKITNIKAWATRRVIAQRVRAAGTPEASWTPLERHPATVG